MQPTGFIVKDTKLKLRGSVWQYRSRVPERLKALYASNGNDPDKRIAISLQTNDPAIALVRKRMVESWLESGGVGIIDFDSPRKHYLEQSTLLGIQPIDERFAIREPIIDPSILDGLRTGHIDPSTLTQQQLAAVAATLFDDIGQPPTSKYKYTLTDALTDYKTYRKGQIKPKTLDAYDRSVTLFLDNRSDIALDDIESPKVAAWIDSLSATLSYSSRKNHVNRLCTLFAHARRLGHCIDRRNPLEKHHLGQTDAKPVQQMLDMELLNILPRLSSDSDKAWAVLARYHGCRMAELAYAEIVTVEEVVCFSIKEIEESEWSPKTDAGTRLVPIRKALIAYAENYQPRLKNSRDYTKRFGNVKKKLYPDRNRTLVFHSLRHTFTTFAYREGYNEQQVSWVTGHKDKRGSGESAKRYFHGYSVAYLSEIIESIPALSGYE